MSTHIYMLQIMVWSKCILQVSGEDLEPLTISLAYPRMHKLVGCPSELWIYVLVGTGLSAYCCNWPNIGIQFPKQQASIFNWQILLCVKDVKLCPIVRLLKGLRILDRG